MGIFGWTASPLDSTESRREITEGSASSAAHPESNTIGQNVLSLLQTFIQRLWEVILTWVWIVSPSLRLAESMKKEEMKIHTDGSLSIYQLPMKEEITLPQKMIAAKSVGELGQFQERVLLVVGATGAGKSSLINGIVNYIIGVKWEDDFRFKVAIEDVPNTESYMKYLTAYTFYPMRGSPLLYKLTIIDTPGFGDSEGLKRDKDIAVQIKEFFSIPPPNGVHHLDGIAFVTQASPTRLTQHQIYIFNSILSLFGKDLCKNIFLMVTFSDHEKPPILQALNDANLTVSDKHFKFNNSVLFKDNKDKDERSFDALCWKMSFQTFADFFTELSSAKSIGIELTKEVLTKRDKLHTLLEHMVQDVATGAKKVKNMEEDEKWHTAQSCHVRLNEIALKSNPVFNVDHLLLLIESEKQQVETGHTQRIEYLEEAKRQAEMLLKKKYRLAETARLEKLKLNDGTPSIYKLQMREELKNERKNIAKQSIGEPGQCQEQEKVLILIGATGSGKSTLINGMANYIMGVKWEDDFRFQLVIDDPKVSKSRSQTQYITAYTFHPMEGSAVSYKLTVIDTPGFGDLEGLKSDRDIARQIKEFFSIPSPDGIHNLDGIAFVTQASLTRLTPHQEYIFNSVLSLFGKDLGKHIFLMVTFADHEKPPILQALNDANLTVIDRHLKFNNSALFADNKNEDAESNDALFWKMNFRAFADIFTELSSSKSVSIELTKEVLTKRDMLQTLLEHMVQDVATGANRVENIWEDERWHTAQKCHVRLNEIAFRSTPVFSVDHLQLLIESEKQQAETGHAQRIEYLEQAKRQAGMLLKEKYRLAEAARLEKLKLNDGTPSIYKLQVKEELPNERKKISKQSIGDPGQCQEQEKVLLVIGATGSGKSTLINGMANYIMGVKWEDDFRFQLVIDDPKVSKSRSQTQHITAYTFHPMEGSAVSYKLTVIDTPGFGDLEGLKSDRDIAKQIKEFFSIPSPDGIHQLDGIAFVTRASLTRLTPHQEYIFNSVLSMFGKDLGKNIFLMVTFADHEKPPILQVLNDANLTVSDRHFKFNNSVLFADNKDKDERSFDALCWKMSFEAFADFFTELSSAKSIGIELTKEVLTERDKLQSLLEHIVQDVATGAKRVENIREFEKWHTAQNCHVRLYEIALKSNPVFNVNHLQLLIESEKQEAEPGHTQRIEYLEEAKRQAEMLLKNKHCLAEAARLAKLKLNDGTPSIYKLQMKEELRNEKKKITKQSIGDPGQREQQEKVLLVIGATGSGKSTLINGMTNYIMGVKWEDDFRFQLVIDDPKVVKSRSQTQYITSYTFHPMEGSAVSYKLTVIDTPGFGDSEGLKRDKAIAVQIKEFFSIPPPNGVHHLDGIAFVTQAFRTRLTPHHEYIFNSVLSLFGKDLGKNIFLMVTFADQEKPTLLQALNDANLTESGRRFKFNNSVLFADNKDKDKRSFDALCWKMSFEAFADFFTELSSAKSIGIELTKEVLTERDKLHTLLEHMVQDVATGAKRVENREEDEKWHTAQNCHFRLYEIALKSDPVFNVDHLQLLIESEKQQVKTGYEQRIEYLEQAKRQAEMLLKKEYRLAEAARLEKLKLNDGTPSIYKLQVKEELKNERKNIAKQSIGEPCQCQEQEKVLLLIGATGSGKSTLINGLANYIMGVKWEDDFRFQLVIDDPKVFKSRSQTQYITAYTFHPMEGSAVFYKLTVIDTPGFGDSEGLKSDRDISKQIKEFFSIPSPDGIHNLDGIAFVTQASLTRLTPHQEYIFNSVLSLFGKDLGKNIFLMVTFADHEKPPILQALNDANLTVSDRHFKFNNSVLFADNKNEHAESIDALFWKMNFQTFAELFTELSSSKSVGIELTKEVLNERHKLQTLLEHMVQDVATGAKRVENMREDERWQTAKNCHVRLNEMALKSNPVFNVNHLQLLIESEKQQAETGHAQRIEYLEEAKRQAEMLLKKKYRLAEAARLEKLKLNDGTPSIYKLQMKEELKNERKKIAKQSIGEPGQCQGKEKVLLVIGATGSGKSTLINGMANYIMGVKWEDDFRFQLVIDDPKVSKSRSQTQYITAYTFHPMEGSAVSYKLTVIDTPGFGDSAGLKSDKDIAKQIKEFFSIPSPNGINQLDGIAFVTRASLTRLTPHQEYIFNSVLSMFGKDLGKNIFLMVTFADHEKPPILQALNDANLTVSDRHLKFNNSALFADNKNEDEVSFDALFWKMNFRAFVQLFAQLSSSKSDGIELTKEVLTKRDKLQSLLEHMVQDVANGAKRVENMWEDERWHTAQNCHVRLNEIAFRSNPVFNVDHLQLLIESEKQQAEIGHLQRVKYLEEAKRQAEMLFKKHRLAEAARLEELKLNDGTPSIYKLQMKEELRNERKKIAKQSIGEPVQCQEQEKVLLVIGATGSGKSTLINGMVNYFMGVRWEDDFRFQLVIEDPKVSKSRSQTQYITAYTFHRMEGSALSSKLTVIDTPGFGDSEGLKRDKEITKQINEFFSIPPPNGVSHLDGIGFVIQASQARLTTTQEYIFSSVLSIFGKDLSRNIFMMLTFADSQKPPVLDAIKDAGIPNHDKTFKFNNSALVAENKGDGREINAMFWKMGYQSFKAFFDEFSKAEGVQLEMTKLVLKEREQLAQLLNGLRPQINQGLDKIEEMRQEECVLQQRNSEIESNKEFTYTVQITKPRKMDLSGTELFTTICLRCNSTCHVGCDYADDNEKAKCCAMDQLSGKCVVCPQDCHWTYHKNVPFYYVYDIVLEERTSEDLKKKYESAKKGKTKVEGMIARIGEELEKMHQQVMRSIVKAQKCLHRLDEIALKPNPLTNVEYVKLLIEAEKQTANRGWKQRIKYLEEAKEQAEVLSNVKTAEAVEEIIKETTHKGWYKRFKYWIESTRS